MTGEASGRERFETLWRPIIGFAVLVGFAAQPLLPLISPFTIVVAVVSGGTFYFLAHENIVGAKNLGPITSQIAPWIGLVSVASVVVGVCQMWGTAVQISPQCNKLRSEMLRAKDSAAADTYTALHCPVYFNLLPSPRREQEGAPKSKLRKFEPRPRLP